MRERQLGRVLTAAVGLILAVALSGCSAVVQFVTQGDRSKPESPAEMHNVALADEVQTLLAHFWEGGWHLPAGGNVRTFCGDDQGEDAYLFYGSWFTPEQASTPADEGAAELAVAELRTWLESQGWNDLEEYEFTSEDGGVTALGLEGTKGERGIRGMQATFYFEGEFDLSYPQVVVDIDSECLVADR